MFHVCLHVDTKQLSTKVEQPGSSRLAWLPEFEFVAKLAAVYHKRLCVPQLIALDHA